MARRRRTDAEIQADAILPLIGWVAFICLIVGFVAGVWVRGMF